MIESNGRKALRAIVVVGALLAVSSVVLWPLAVLALPLLLWAAGGGTLARWSASLVGALVVFVVAEVAVWLTVEAVRGAPPGGLAWLLVTAVVVAPPALVGFLRGARWVRARARVATVAGGPSSLAPAP
jgi:hypothetical protein